MSTSSRASSPDSLQCYTAGLFVGRRPGRTEPEPDQMVLIPSGALRHSIGVPNTAEAPGSEWIDNITETASYDNRSSSEVLPPSPMELESRSSADNPSAVPASSHSTLSYTSGSDQSLPPFPPPPSHTGSNLRPALPNISTQGYYVALPPAMGLQPPSPLRYYSASNWPILSTSSDSNQSSPTSESPKQVLGVLPLSLLQVPESLSTRTSPSSTIGLASHSSSVPALVARSPYSTSTLYTRSALEIGSKNTPELGTLNLPQQSNEAGFEETSRFSSPTQESSGPRETSDQKSGKTLKASKSFAGDIAALFNNVTSTSTQIVRKVKSFKRSLSRSSAERTSKRKPKEPRVSQSLPITRNHSQAALEQIPTLLSPDVAMIQAAPANPEPAPISDTLSPSVVMGVTRTTQQPEIFVHNTNALQLPTSPSPPAAPLGTSATFVTPSTSSVDALQDPVTDDNLEPAPLPEASLPDLKGLGCKLPSQWESNIQCSGSGSDHSLAILSGQPGSEMGFYCRLCPLVMAADSIQDIRRKVLAGTKLLDQVMGMTLAM